MAFADYSERVEQSAAQLLAGYDAVDFRARLVAARVAIAVDGSAAATTEGRASADLLVRLLARLFPSLGLVALEGGGYADELRSLAIAINPNLETFGDLDENCHVLVVGATVAPMGQPVYIGSDGWIARLSRKAPVSSANTSVPFGAGAAACLGAANVFRAVFSDHLENGGPDHSVTVSMLNFETGARATNADLPTGAHFGTVQLVGAGAIGQAAVWALARVGGLAGHLDVVDPERTEITNLQRYVLTTREDDDARKTRIAAAQFPGAGAITVAQHCATWADYVASRGSHDFDLVATALDSARARVEVQGALPRRIVNAWTQPGDCGVSRHSFLGQDACLACLYLPSGTRRNEDEILAEELGMPERSKEIATMLETGRPVDIDFLRDVAARRSMNLELLKPLLGVHLRDFRQRAVCGGMLVSATDAANTPIEVPMAFQSALAGVMMAAEIVATQVMERKGAPATKSAVDLMRPFAKRLNVAVLKNRDGEAHCICEDADFQRAYARKYPHEQRRIATGPEATGGSPHSR